MKTRHRLILTLTLLALPASIFAPKICSGQTDQPTEAPADVSFTIRVKDGKTKFYQGELITVEMLFSSKTPNLYQLYAGTYDRGGRFEVDKFHVDPANGVADPTVEYFHTALLGFGGGGLSPGPITLEEKPYVVSRDLNELVRFDQPGHYRLYITNSRVGIPVVGGRTRTVKSLLATSNTIEFDVLRPDPNWQKAQLREAGIAIQKNGKEDQRACRTLRFMNSAEAEAEIIRFYPVGCQGDFQLGLVGSPRRSALIEAMETQIAAPDYPVTANFIHVLSSLVFMKENPDPLPAYVPGDPENTKLLQAAGKRRREAFDEIITRYTRQVAATVSRKTKAAQAVTLDALLSFDSSTRTQKLTKDNLAVDQLVASLPDLFLELPTERQYTLLSSFWGRLRSPAMLPVLRQLVVQAPTPRNNLIDLRSIALRRLYQLSPDEGRNIILREMKIIPHRIRADVLAMLPDTELAEVDQMLAEALDKAPAGESFPLIEEFSDLIARYAGANSLTRVKSGSEHLIGRMACAPQTSLLAYFLRVDPDYGASALRQALAAHGEGQTGCYRFAFEELGRKFMSPAIEDIALEHLDDTDRIVAIQAIVLLRQKGSAKAEKPLLDRLERWHAEWKTRADEVQPQIKNGMVSGEPMHFELELARALTSATAWTTDADQLKHIEELCLTPNARNEVQATIKALDDRTIHLSVPNSDEFSVNTTLGNYHPESIDQLKTKLSTMPKDSHFIWDCYSQDAEAEARLFQELKAFLAERGMTLERPKEEKKETAP